LQKYHGFPEKYEVQDGYIKCGGLWTLEIDNNHPDYIVVYLGDLGYLSNPEEVYWKSFNISPQGTISQVAFKRDFEAEFTDPVSLDLVFKSKYHSLNKFWEDKYGWFLFLPLKTEERFHLSSLHIPVNTSQQEFDNQVLSLTKLLIDSLNEQAINSQISEDSKKNRGINKLKMYLSTLGKKRF